MGNAASVPATQKTFFKLIRPAPPNARPSVSLDGYVTFEIRCYVQNGQKPLQVKVRALSGFKCPIDTLPLIQSLPIGDPRCEMHMWDGDVSGWTCVRRDTLSIDVSDTTVVVVLRLPDVTICVDLPEAIGRQQFARFGPDRAQWEIVDLRHSARKDSHGDDFLVFAWGAPGEHPKMFVVRLTLGGVIRFADNRLLARHLGIDYPAKDTTGYRAWDTVKATWTFNRHDEAFRPAIGTDFAILRHADNKAVIPLAFFLERFEEHRLRPVPRRDIDVRALAAKIAVLVNVQPVVEPPPPPQQPGTPRRSPRTHKQVDYKKANVQGLDLRVDSNKGQEKKPKKRALRGPSPAPDRSSKKARVSVSAASATGSATKHHQKAKQLAKFTTRRADGVEEVDLEKFLATRHAKSCT